MQIIYIIKKNEMENKDIHTPVIQETISKKPRGRPAKYAKEEREQKYKELSKQWSKEHKEERVQSSSEYQERARFAYKLLCEIWNDDMMELKSEHHKNLIKNLVENKKILA